MNNTPVTWAPTNLGAATSKVADRDHFTPTYVVEGMPMVSPKDFNSHDHIDFSACQYITREAHERNRKKTDIAPGDIIFTRIGARLGKACLVTREMPEFSLLHSAVMVRPHPQKVTSEYLLYVLKGPEIQGQIGKEIQSIGVPDLGLDSIKNLSFTLPPIPQQRRIAEILSTLDETIEQTEALITKYQQIKAGLMHDLFTRGVTSAGNLRPSRTQAPQLYKESTIGWIPKQWEVRPWGDLTASWAVGPRFAAEEYTENGNVATLRTTDVDNDGAIDYSTMPHARLDLAGFRNHLLQPNDFVISRSGTCGIAAVFESFDLPVLPGAFLIRFRFNHLASPHFLKFYANSPSGAPSIARIAEGGVQKNIRGTSLCRVPVPVPTPKEQALILDQVQAINEARAAELRHLHKLRLQRRGLLHDLLIGRVPVNVPEPVGK